MSRCRRMVSWICRGKAKQRQHGILWLRDEGDVQRENVRKQLMRESQLERMDQSRAMEANLQRAQHDMESQSWLKISSEVIQRRERDVDNDGSFRHLQTSEQVKCSFSELDMHTQLVSGSIRPGQSPLAIATPSLVCHVSMVCSFRGNEDDH